MKRLLSATCILIALSSCAFAQDDDFTQPFSQLKKDYKHVQVVAHVKIESIKFAATDVHPLYVVQGEVIEIFKGRIKRNQQLEFYFHAEEGFDVNRLVGKEYVVFLEGKYPIPPGGKGWYELENSSVTPTEKNIDKMRRIRSSTRKRKK